MNKVVKIVIQRAEGPRDANFSPIEVKGFNEANRVLSEMAKTAPDNGCYDKTNFTVYYDNGETYKGQYELKRNDTEEADLAKHIYQEIAFYAGLYKPCWMDQSKYEFVLMNVPQKEREEFNEFLKNYELDYYSSTSQQTAN